MLSVLPTLPRLVRCPRCRQLLPELPHFQVYRCGGCRTVLKAKGLDRLPLLGNGSHDERSNHDDQHYWETGSNDSSLGDYDEQINVASVPFQGSVDSNPSVSPLASISARVGSDDFNPRISTDYDDSGTLASAVGPSGSNPPGSVAINIGLQVENNDPHHRTRVTSVELTFILVGFILEMLSAGFYQVSSASKPLYALISLLLAIAAVLTCVLELIHNGIKDKDASPNRPVFGMLPDIFGLGLAVIQCVCSAVQYYFLHQHASNPMKLPPLPLFFFTYLVVFKLKGN